MEIFIKIIIYIVYFITLYLSIFFLVSFFIEQDKIRNDKKKKELKHFPTVSIIVPAYNEGKGVLNTARSLFAQNYPKDKLKIYIVDDGSKDDTYEYMKKAKEESTHDVILIKQKQNKGKATALNTALEMIDSEYFACLDADSEVSENALYESISVFEERKKEGIAIVTPVMKVKSPKKTIEWMQRIEYATAMFLVRIVSYIDCNYVAPGPFSLYKTKIIKELGGYSLDTLTEDQDIAYAVQNLHYKIVQSPNTEVFTKGPKTTKALYKQRNRWFKGSLQCIKKYKHVVFNKKYGDFGLFQMPFNILLFSLAFVSVLLSIYFTVKPIVDNIRNLSQVDYDIIPYLKSMSVSFDLLSWNWESIIMSVVLIGTALVVLYISHKEQKEPLNQYNVFLIVPYFFIYYLFLSFVATVALYEFLTNKVQKW